MVIAQTTKTMSENDAGPSGSGSEPPFLPDHPTLDSFTKECMRTVGKAIQATNQLPSKEKQDWDFYQTFKGFRDVMAAEEGNVRGLLDKLLAWNGVRARTGEHVADMMDLLTEANDHILERVNTQLDDAAGLRKTEDPVLLEVTRAHDAQMKTPVSGSWNKRREGEKLGEKPTAPSLVTAKNIRRPQIAFKDCIDNSNSAFVPSLKEKPNSMKPLSILPEYDASGVEHYSHPYLYELEMYKPQDFQLKHEEPPKVDKDKIEDVPLIFVQSEEQLKSMIVELKKEREIAVDLEHHWYRSFLGLTSLIQISSRDKDYIVDPYPLWKELNQLNEVLTDPKIVKVLHGSDKDVIWLQRDFSLYIVNMFDTHIAAKMLEFPAGTRSYANILFRYCGVRADKTFQLADWRMRPLPENMVNYARTDTRYLIHIYHRMKNELLAKANDQENLLRATLNAGADLCKTRFVKKTLTPTSHLDFLAKSRGHFNSRQLHALDAIFSWRDKIAREEDESEAYVLPPHMLLKICEELPREMQGILACCTPVPPLVKQNLQRIHQIILEAREKPLTHVEAKSSSQITLPSSFLPKTADLVSDPLKTPLDLSYSSDLDTTVLLDTDGSYAPLLKRATKMPEPAMSIFGYGQSGDSSDSSDNIEVYLSPYQRFVMLKPYLRFLNEQDQNDSKPRSDSQRIESIKEHFDALTAMTAEEYNKENPKKEEEVAEESSEEDEPMREEENLNKVNVQPAKMDKNSEKSQRKKKKKREEKIAKAAKRKADENGAENGAAEQFQDAEEQEEKEVEEVDLENSDFTQFQGSQKKRSKKGQFNEWNDFNQALKKGGKGRGKKMKGGKKAGKSMSFRK